jgi:1-acyl-sn-glycerol-3-phosphate acyltransferase
MKQIVGNSIRFAQILHTTWRAASDLFRAEKSPTGRTREFTHHIMESWAKDLLRILRVEVTQIGQPNLAPTLFVGNHISYLDIPLLMSAAPTVFIAKKELANWPFFGRGMKSVGTLFVDRSSTHSRKNAADAIAPFIQNNQQSVTLFPSGTTRLIEEKPWRWGAFLIAKRNNIPLQPFRIVYSPARRIAYIDDDFFPTHLWRLLGSKNLKAEIEFHPPIQVQDPEQDALKWWAWSREKLTEG